MIISIKHKKAKTFKDVSIQCERIFTLYINGFGTDKMYQSCESIYFKVYKENGGY